MGRFVDLAKLVPIVEDEVQPDKEAEPDEIEDCVQTGEEIRQREAEAVASLRTATFVRLFKERRFEERSTVKAASFRLWMFR